MGKAVQLSDPELVTVVQTIEKTADVPVGFSATIQQEKQPETLGKSIPASVQGLRLSPAAYGLMREFGVAAPVVPQFVVLPSQSDRTPAGFDDSNQEAQATWAVARVGRLIAQTAVIDMAIFSAQRWRYPMCDSTCETISPSVRSTKRSTPWVLGC